MSMGFPRQEYWSALPFPPPEDLPDTRMKSASPASPVLQADSLPSEPATWPKIKAVGHQSIIVIFSQASLFIQ